MAEILSNSEEDRLTSLPDTLLLEILSHLPFKSAAATSTLSGRWCYLWTQLPCIFLDGPWPRAIDSDHSQEFYQFITTVDRILHKITSPIIRTFHLHIPYPLTVEHDEFEVCSASLEAWIKLVCARMVVKLKVSCDFPFFIGPQVPLPSCVFETESLVELELGGNICCVLPESGTVSLPNLKKLVLVDLPSFYAFKTIIKSCPTLEMLSLELDSDSANLKIFDISSQNLKSLIIRGKSRHFIFMIDAPMLEHIEICGFLGIYKFVKYPSRLFRADLDIWNFSYSRTDYLSLIPEVLQGISSVESLKLLNGLAVFNALNDFDADVDVGSVFCNLVDLTMDMSTNEVDWGDRNPIPMYLLSQLKKIKLLNVKGNANDVKLLEYILSKAIVLERLYVSSACDGYGDDDSEIDQLWRQYKLSKTLLLVPRSSKVEFVGGYIHLYNDASQNGCIVRLSGEDPACGETPDTRRQA